MVPPFALAGIAEMSAAESSWFLILAFGPYALALLTIVVGLLVAARSEMPPEDYGETLPGASPKTWANEV